MPSPGPTNCLEGGDLRRQRLDGDGSHFRDFGALLKSVSSYGASLSASATTCEAFHFFANLANLVRDILSAKRIC